MEIDLGARVAALAAVVGGHSQRGSTWFDGFWDFVQEYRDRLGTAWEIQGVQGVPWAILFMLPDAVARDLRVEIFVESKKARHDIAAERRRGEGPDRRQHDALIALGFEVIVDDRGVRAFRTADAARREQSLDQIFEVLPPALQAAVRLACRGSTI